MYEEKSSILSEEEISEKLEIYVSGRNLNSKGNFPVSINYYLLVTLLEPEKPPKTNTKKQGLLEYPSAELCRNDPD